MSLTGLASEDYLPGKKRKLESQMILSLFCPVCEKIEC